MPIIEFQNDGLDGLRVLSTMYFPTAESNRVRLLQGFALQVGAVTLPELGVVTTSTRDTRPWPLTVSDAGWRGTMAGEALLRLALLHEHGVQEPSMRKVVASLQVFAVELRADPETGMLSDAREDRAIPLTERSIWNYFADFKTVCHLWAAHRILERDSPFFDIPVVLSDKTQLMQFLAYGEWFLNFGASHLTRNDKAKPPLDHALAHSPGMPVQAEKPDLGPCSSSLINALAQYRAH